MAICKIKDKKVIPSFVLICFLAFTPIICSAGELKGVVPYISPGIRFGWDFEKKFTFSTKISLGIMFDGGFANITWGCKYPVFQDAYITDPHFEKYDYLDLQAGFIHNPKRTMTLYTGGGAGIIFYKENGAHKTAPRMTVFSGCIVFPTLDIIFLPGHTRWDTGLQIVAPIPLGLNFSGLNITG